MATNLVFDGVLLSPQKPAKVTIGDRSNFSSGFVPSGKLFFQKQHKPEEFVREKSDVSYAGLRNQFYHQRIKEKLRNRSLKLPLQSEKSKQLRPAKKFESILSKSQSFHGITSKQEFTGDKTYDNVRNLSSKNKEKQKRVPTISMSLLNISKNDTKNKSPTNKTSVIDGKHHTKPVLLSKQSHDTFNINNSLINLPSKDLNKNKNQRSSWNMLIHGDSSKFNADPPPHHNDSLLYKKNMMAHSFITTTNKKQQQQHKQKWRSFYHVPNSNTMGEFLNSSPVVKHPRNQPPERFDNQAVSNPDWGEYQDPLPGAGHAYISRMERMSQLQSETVRWEKCRKFRRKKQTL